MRRAAMLAVLGAVVLTGCATTQQTAARLRLNGDRVRVSQVPTDVAVSDPQVAVGPVALVRGRSRTAVIVTLRNLSGRAITDLPLVIESTAGHSTRYLNTAAGFPYFGNHIPAVGAHRTLRWVFTTGHPLTPGARLSARIGGRQSVPAGVPTTLPDISTRVIAAVHAADGPQELIVAVDNLSSVPQYQLPVFALASRDGHYVAAGGTDIASLAGDTRVIVRVRVIGDPAHALVALEAPATIYE